jgi:hypothetical protein
MAAIATAKKGMRVAFIEPRSHVGGMVTGGLSSSDVDGQQQLIGGLARQFFVSAGAHYGKSITYAFEPHIAEQIMRDMLSAAGVQVFFHSRLSGISKQGARISEIRMEDGRDFTAQVFIDSSYEGDLMKAAGLSIWSVGNRKRNTTSRSPAVRTYYPAVISFGSPCRQTCLEAVFCPMLFAKATWRQRGLLMAASNLIVSASASQTIPPTASQLSALWATTRNGTN